jgi:hypothetical protein
VLWNSGQSSLKTELLALKTRPDSWQQLIRVACTMADFTTEATKFVNLEPKKRLPLDMMVEMWAYACKAPPTDGAAFARSFLITACICRSNAHTVDWRAGMYVMSTHVECAAW